MPTSTVDLSAGLVPKQGGDIDLSAGLVPKASAQPAWYTPAGLKSLAYEGADALTRSLPAAGATVGALIGSEAGPVGSVGGAGLGGMAGSSAKQLIRNALGFETPQTYSGVAGDIAKEGAVQGGVQAASEALPLAAGPLRNAAETQYVRALAPTTKANKAIAQDIAPEMLDRNLHGSLPDLADQAGAQASALRPALTQAYGSMPASAGDNAGTQILADLEKLKGRYIVNGFTAKPQAVDAITGVQNIVQQFGQNIAPQDLRQLKSIFDEQPAAAGAYAGADLASQYTLKAQKAAANSIRNIVHSASPDVAALDNEVNFWLNVQRVTSASAQRQAGQAGGLVKVFTPLAAAGAGAGMGYQMGAHAGLESAGAVVLTGLATNIVRSAAWKTASAVTKDALADALASGNAGAVAALASRFGVAASGATSQPAQPALPTQQTQ